MVSTDPISDMFSRIRNGASVNKSTVSMPYSKIKEEIALILAKNGFLKAVKTQNENGRKLLVIEISGELQPAVITSIKRLSRPGKRLYVQSKEIPRVKRGRGMVVLSTSQGIMTGTEAATKRLGGEVICEVY